MRTTDQIQAEAFGVYTEANAIAMRDQFDGRLAKLLAKLRDLKAEHEAAEASERAS
jgi:hypothetical protein